MGSEQSKARRSYRLDAAGESAVVDAIRAAERGSRAEVRVHLEQRCPGDALERAREVFHSLGMQRTEEHTGVLLYVAPVDRKVAVYAGKGVQPEAPDAYWKSVTDAVAGEAREERLAHGITRALKMLGKLLREKVSGDDVKGNELPDAVTRS